MQLIGFEEIKQENGLIIMDVPEMGGIIKELFLILEQVY